MHDIRQLEEEWIQYKKNKRKPYYIFSLLFVMAIGVLFYMVTLKKDTALKNVEKVESKVAIKSVEKPLINGSINTLEIEKPTSSTVINSVDVLASKTKDFIPTLPVLNDIPIIDTVITKTKISDKTLENKRIPKKEIKQKTFSDKPHKKIYLNIKKSSNSSAYKEVEKRFNQFKDPDDSLFLAKMYYEQKKYKKSEYWALRTNKIDKNIEASWIIFVKSKINLGYKEDAIHILSNYIKQSDSQEAKNLLLKLKR